MTSFLSSSSGERSETGGRLVILRPIEDRTGGGAREREPAAKCDVSYIGPEQIAFGAAASPGLRREGAACRRMTKVSVSG